MTELEQESPSLLVLTLNAVDNADSVALEALLADQYPGEIAHLLESLPGPARKLAWEALSDDNRGEVLAYLHDEVRGQLLDTLSPEQIVSAAQDLDTADFADILEELPNETAADILDSLDRQDRARVETVLSYPEDSAGRLMDCLLYTSPSPRDPE